MKINKIELPPIMTDAKADAMSGVLLDEMSYRRLFTTDVDVYDKATGQCIAKFRKGAIPGKLVKSGYDNLLSAAVLTDSHRGTASGLKDGVVMKPRVLKSGKISNTLIASVEKNETGIAGYFDPSARFPNCRLTAYTRYHFDKFKLAYPLIKHVDKMYAELMPVHYKKQRKAADSSSKDFVIPGTAFSTITVNKNWQTAVHKDKGDFKDGFGNLVALRDGKYTGGYLVLVKWGCAFDLQNGDLLMMDVHQWHGNTPIVKDNERVTRLSLVMYFREKIVYCGSLKEELHKVQNRKRGDSILLKKTQDGKKNRKA